LSSATRFPFFIALSIAFHLVWLFFDYHFPAIAPPQQISFGYVSSDREGFLPETEILDQVAVKPKSPLQLPNPAPLVKTLPQEDHITKKASVVSPLDTVAPKQRLPERSSTVDRESSSVVVTADPADLDAANEPFLMDEGIEAEMVAAEDFENHSNGPTFLEAHVETKGREASVNKVSPPNAEFQAALPRYDLNPKPIYPEVARRRGWEGTVLFEVLVLESGRVGDLEMVQSSGYRSLDRAARKAIRGWVFKAAMSYGLAVDSRVVVPVDFVLERN